MINDISALTQDVCSLKIAAASKASVVLMHMKGCPYSMDNNGDYIDVVEEVNEYLGSRIMACQGAGIEKHRICIDPGIGFGKDMRQNLTILRRLEEYKSIGRPILVGTSRKSTIGNILQVPVHERTYGTAASIAIAIAKGTNIVRVHDVGEMAQVCKMSDAIIREGAQ